MTKSRFGRAAQAAALLVLTTALAACGGVTGTPVAAELDIRTLDVGTYPTLPLDYRYSYPNTVDQARQLAIMRLADQTVTGAEVDPRFRYGLRFEGIADTEDVMVALADVNGPVVERHGMLYGFTSSSVDKEPPALEQSVPGSSGLKVVVFQFPDEATAKIAAADIDAADFSVAADQNQRVVIPGHPEAHAHWRPGVASLGATAARGAYVVSVFVQLTEPEQQAMAEVVRKTFDAQYPLLDALPPLTAEDMVRLPFDPEGMIVRTLTPNDYISLGLDYQAVLAPRGYASQQVDQQEWLTAAREAGIERIARAPYSGRETLLYRLRDDDAATALAGTVLGAGYGKTADAPKDLPDARCGEVVDGGPLTARFTCVVVYQRYVATVQSQQLADAHQQAAAQYSVLANAWGVSAGS